jgi:hypothetical protein
MARFWRFALSQLIWLVAFVYFGFNHRIIDRPGSEIIIFMSLVIGIPVFLNLLLWFTENLIRIFQRNKVDQMQWREKEHGKHKNDHINQVLQELSNSDLILLREQLSEDYWVSEEGEKQFIHNDREITTHTQQNNS